jgi:hypothetical protein
VRLRDNGVLLFQRYKCKFTNMYIGTSNRKYFKNKPNANAIYLS